MDVVIISDVFLLAAAPRLRLAYCEAEIADFTACILQFSNCFSFKKMGIADAIVDLVGSGTTSRENNLKEIAGGVILQSQAVLVASRKSLTHYYAIVICVPKKAFMSLCSSCGRDDNSAND
ncbi:unnamed protein product [Cuscuta campestris]|uniref:ATP phosphoribosyltransferase n=1 Tax=Cuscuta campestris TaxID=132261 RepID=A0A484NBM5_9ASTE|nr:unnamed protein product [Cuscuta campestris]